MNYKAIEDQNEALVSTNATSDKQEILKTVSDEYKKVLFYTYHPLWKYNVSSDAVLKRRNDGYTPLLRHKPKDLFDMLEKLRDRVVTGYDALDMVITFIVAEGHQDLILKILDKDLQIRAGVKLINKAIPELIPEFSVALADKFEAEKAPDFSKETWFWSRKLDGVRCIIKIEAGKASAWTRNGQPILTIQALLDDVEALAAQADLKNFVIDGELCHIDKNGNENFQEMMKLVRKKDFQIERPILKPFDMIDLNDFEKLASKTRLFERLVNLNNLVGGGSPANLISPVKMQKVNNLEELLAEQEKASTAGWEGLMIRKDAPYKGKRSKDLLKLKKFDDAEFKVVDIEMGLIDDGQGRKIDAMVAVTVELEDKYGKDLVKVGSGFSRVERLHLLNNPNDILGKIITVKFFERTVDRDGKNSLRFPTFKGIHGVKREY